MILNGVDNSYKGPPVTPSKSKTETTHVAHRPKLIKQPKYHKSKPKSKSHKDTTDTPLPGTPCLPSEDYAAHEAFYTNWDLIPKLPRKAYPLWDKWSKYGTVPNALGRIPRENLEKLLRHEVIELGPNAPSPHDLAVLNILQKKVEGWEKAEETLHEKRRGFYCHDHLVTKRAWFSWMLTQNRDFGSAVWRWLRLDNWDQMQSPQMKGLLWHQAVYGDWDRYDNIKVRNTNVDVLNEWKWNQGLERDKAQKEFIANAVKMGIPPVQWDTPSTSSHELKFLPWTEAHTNSEPPSVGNHEVRRIITRSMLPPPSTITDGPAGNSLQPSSTDIGVVLESLVRLLTWLGSTSWRKSGDTKVGTRLHARDWKVAAVVTGE